MKDIVYTTQQKVDDMVTVIHVLTEMLTERMILCPPTEDEQQRIKYLEKLVNSIRDIEKQNI